MRKILFVLCCAFMTIAAQSSNAKIGVVIASFGTTHPTALKSILNIKNAVRQKYPEMDVRVAFTSNIIRKIWQKRSKDAAYRVAHKDVPKAIYNVKTPLATIADMQNDGIKVIAVQSTHIYAGEEFTDLCSYVAGLNAIKTEKTKFMPFKKLVIGRPALGRPGITHSYTEDIKIAAKALSEDVERAKKTGSILVYMGHGNEYFSTGVYAELQDVLRLMYKTDKIFVGTVEGFPSFDDVLDGLKKMKTKKILLKPLMLVAGDHANNDMAGDKKDSWKSILESNDFSVNCVIEGLGMNKKWVNIYLSHLDDAFSDAGIKTGKE